MFRVLCLFVAATFFPHTSSGRLGLGSHGREAAAHRTEALSFGTICRRPHATRVRAAGAAARVARTLTARPPQQPASAASCGAERLRLLYTAAEMRYVSSVQMTHIMTIVLYAWCRG